MKRALLPAVLFLASLSVARSATNLYWSADGINAGGAGAWNVTGLNFGTSISGPFDRAWTNANVDSVILDGTVGTITVGAAVTVGKITNNINGNTFATASSKITFSGTGAGVEHFGTTKLTLPTIGGTTFTKTGSGRVELSNNANTVTRYTILGGVITTANTNKWGSGTGATNFLVLDNGAGWGIDSTSQSLSPERGIYLNSGGGALGSISGTLTLTVNSRITGPGSLNFPAPNYSAAATWVLVNKTNDYQGSTFVKGGTLRLGASEVLPNTTHLQLTTGGSMDLNGFDETVGDVLVNSSTATISGSTNTLISTNLDLRASGTISAKLGGSAFLTKTTAGTVTLTGANTYSGPTTNLDGTLAINGAATFGNGAGVLVLSGGNLTQTANRTLGNTLLNPVIMTANTIIQNGSTGTGAILFRHGGAWTTDGGQLTIKNTTSTGAGSFDVILTNAFNFTQPILIGDIGDTLPCQLTSFTPSGADQTFSGEISGYGTLRRSVSSGNGGRTFLTVDNVYTGGTIVTAGTLLVNNPGPGSGTGPGTNTVSGGGTIGGSGIIGGPVVVNNQGSIAAGNSAGIVTLQGGLTMSGGGTNVWELATPTDDSNGVAGTDFDQIALTGGELDLSGNSRLLLKFIGTASAPYSTNTFWQSNHTWTIVNVSGAGLNTTNLPFTTIVNGAFNAGYFSNYVGTGGSIILTYTTNAPSAPNITVQPASRTNNVGTTATFSVTAFGTDPVSYQWHYQDVTNPIAGATGSAYSKSNVQLTDAGGYFVTITNLLGGTTSSVAVLTVIQPPSISAHPQNITTNHGATVTFSVTAAGSAPLAYQWYFQTTNGPIGGATGTSHTVVGAQPADAGNYFVIVTNIGGKVTSSNALLKLITRPTIVSLEGSGTTNVVVTWDSFSNSVYQLQYNTNLADSNWYPVTTVTGSVNSTTVTNQVPSGEPRRFYRVLVQ
jgi:autotransporter-associated beta strand protein